MLEIHDCNMLFPLSAHSGVSQGLSLSHCYDYTPVLRICPPTFTCLKIDSDVSTHHHTVTLFLAYSYPMALLLKNLAHYVFTKYPLCTTLFSLNVMLDQTFFPKKRHKILLRDDYYIIVSIHLGLSLGIFIQIMPT